MTYANITDVSTRLGRPIASADEIAQVNAWLADAEALILARIPGLAALITAGNPTVELLAMIESNVVIRKIRNPEGKQSEGIDDYRYTRNDDARRGELFLTDEEWALLTPSAASSSFTIRPYGAPDDEPGTWATPTVWVPDP